MLFVAPPCPPDAVMAFWNMPRAVADHETKAVKAALACRAAIPALADGQAPGRGGRGAGS